jgi:hypothetical protein
MKILIGPKLKCIDKGEKKKNKTNISEKIRYSVSYAFDNVF